MLKVGDTVIVKPPFTESFPFAYVITEIVVSEDASTAYILGEHGGFDATYLEAAP
jgi:hypothetical protein